MMFVRLAKKLSLARAYASVPLLATMALAAFGHEAKAGEATPEAVRIVRKVVEAESRSILQFACPNAPRLNRVDFDGYRKLDEGYEATFTFKWQHGLFTYYIKFAFLAQDNGDIESVTIKDYGGIGLEAPFGASEVSDTQLSEMRASLRNVPSIGDSRKLLDYVDSADAKKLCLLYLQLRVRSRQ